MGIKKRLSSLKSSKTTAAATAAVEEASKTLVLVTGGSGFLGRHLVENLIKDGRFQIRVFDIREPLQPEQNVEYVTGDLRKLEDVKAACQGAEIVFHVATAAPTGANAYNHELMRSVNVDGTQNVIDACVALVIPRLVYTSSASVVFEGKDLVNVDESTPYAKSPLDYYTKTKVEGEKLILAANGKGGVSTVALRPSGIFGEHDQLLVVTTVNNARKGKMKYIIGDGKNLMDWTYAGNVADAHIAAADALMKSNKGKTSPAGKAYFITNDDPRPFWGFMGDLSSGLGYDRPRIHLPFYLIYFIACLLQYVIAPVLSPIKKIESDFTPSRIKISGVNRVFNCTAAKKDLGYKPAVSIEDGLDRTIKAFSHLKNDAP